MASNFLPGESVVTATSEALPEPLKGLLDVTETRETWLGAHRGGTAAAARTDVGDLEEDDIVEIQLEGGLKLWQSVADTRSDFAQMDRAVTDQSLLVPRRLEFGARGGAARGDTGFDVLGVKVFKSRLAGQAGDRSALAVARHIEGTLDLGFWRCRRDDSGARPVIARDPRAITAADAAASVLVLIHGTFSSTMGSFADLVDPPPGQPDLWPVLAAAFPGGIYALEHRSVTVSPLQNALDLVQALPKGARVSTLCYSRGGLVAELLARAARVDTETGEMREGGAFDEVDAAIFKDDPGDAALLDQLARAMADKAIVVERTIRIAGPLGGTTLASRRLDRALSVALNTFELVPVLKASVAYGLLKSFLLGFVKAKNDTLPGLEAMMPSSPLVRMLNRRDVISAGSLHVVTGDNEGKGVFSRLRNLAVDVFFGSDNDFVVNTRSMERGSARVGAPSVTPIVSPDITHFGYFRDPAGRNAIAAAANATAPGLVADAAGARLMVEPVLRPIGVSRARDAGSLPVCFYLPGVMGTHLRHNGLWVWSNPARMVSGGMKRLKVPGPGTVTPDEMMDRFYGDLARYLSRTHDVVLFPYDWRESVLTTGADRLAAEVRKALAETRKPIRFLAHSMGGLVVRAFIDAHPSLWAEVKRRGDSRLVMLGTPNGGAFSMVHTLMGRARAIRQLSAADLVHSKRELLEIVSSMPGPVQLLPADADGHYLRADTWQEFRRVDAGDWVVPDERVFSAARSAHDLFQRQELDPAHVCYVAGLGDALTPSGVRIDLSADPSKRLQFLGTREGDGTVTWATGVPAGIDPYYMRAVHGDLARTSSSFPALLELLETGQTSGLSTQQPIAARGDDTGPVALADPEIEVFPEPVDILDSFMGAGTRPADAPGASAPRTRVTIRNGDLRFSRNPVLVGHYTGDPIAGAERALDSCLDNALTSVRDLGLYPGEIGTCEVILRMGRNPGGAIVAGLGRFGELTPGQLRKTVNRAMLRYVLTLRRRAAEAGKGHEDMDPIGLTTLVIGHRGANMTVQQSVQAILEALAEANRTLRTTPIAHLEFIEIYDDTSFRAASALHRASLNGSVAGGFDFDRRIKSGDGAQLRVDFGLEGGAWQRISVSRPENNSDVLDFTVIVDGAKAQFRRSAVQGEVIERILDESRSGTAPARDLGRLLFQLMIPNELKAFSQNDQKIQLILDEKTAAVPWELMEDAVHVHESDEQAPLAGDADDLPIVVRTPVLRQLISPGTTVPRSRLDNMLVVGDPKSSYPPLRGAEREAREVAQRMAGEGRFDVTALIREVGGIRVLKEVMGGQYKIMHFAAHGVYDDAGPHIKAGLILSDGICLTSAELENMEYVPEFVFLNCCHIGRIEPNTGPIAADLSRTLIQKGVRAVIAAGWAVDDDAALLFAQVFYDSMLNGRSFGDAVHHARIAVFAAHGDTNTWGAYQCYGDPEYRFDERIGGGHGTGERTSYTSADHARKAAVNIARNVGSPHRSRADLIAELDALMESVDPEWQDDARWCEAMGRAYAKLDLFAPAIELLERAKVNHRSTVSVHAIELLENLKVRFATHAWTQAEHALTTARDDAAVDAAKAAAAAAKQAQKRVVRAALKTLDDLDALLGSGGPPVRSKRRELLKGAVCKRKVLTLQPGAPRQGAIREMVNHYAAAKSLAAEADPGLLDHYATFNWLSGHVVLGSAQVDGQPFEAWFSQLLAQNALEENRAPTFWTAVLPAEIEMLRGLRADAAARDTIFERFEAAFRFAWSRGGAFGQARSLREHVHFLKMLMRDAEQRVWMTRIEAFLNDLTWTYRDQPTDEF